MRKIIVTEYVTLAAGSCALVQTLRQQGLVDEYRLACSWQWKNALPGREQAVLEPRENTIVRLWRAAALSPCRKMSLNRSNG